MRSCCSALQKTFDRKTAARDLRRYRRRGPLPSTRRLVDALRRAGATGRLLDIGGGVGAVPLELLRHGIHDVVSVDASAAYSRTAHELAMEHGAADRILSRTGDFVEIAHDIEPADVVTLDRVICCYPEWRRLVELSTARALRLYGIVVPRHRWSLRLVFTAHNLFQALTRNPFRFFVRPPDTIARAIRAHGFEPIASQRTFVWQILVFERASDPTRPLV